MASELRGLQHQRQPQEKQSLSLIEMGPSLAKSQQSTPLGMTVQDNVMLEKLSQTVTGLAEQVNQLTDIVQDIVLQWMTNLETELMGESSA